jgi:Helix-turn-helix domain
MADLAISVIFNDHRRVCRSEGTMSIEDFQNEVTKKLYNIPDAASLCGSVSPWTLRKHISRGTIHVTRIGRRVFLRSEEVERIRREGLPSLRSAEEKVCLTK